MLADAENSTETLKTAPDRRAAARPRRTRRQLAYVVAALAVLAGLGFWGYSAWFAGGRPADRYVTAVVERGDIEETVTATGTLQPRDYVDVGTQVSGQLKIVHVQVGDTVKEGDLLAEIDPTVYLARVDANRAQLQNQRAQLADREAQLMLAEQQLRRQQNLMKEQATTEEALQVAEANVRSLRAQIEAIKAQMRQTESELRGNEANLGYTKIYAPMSGTVVSQSSKQGQTLNANQQAPIILRIADLSTMTVQAQVSEADVPKLRLGMDAYFTTLGGDGQRWFGKLRQILPTPTVTNNVVLYDALFDVPNPDQKLMTQMTAQVFFVLASAKDAVLVPVAALRPAPPEKAREQAPQQNAQAGERRSRPERARTAAGEAPVVERKALAQRAMVRVIRPDGSVEERIIQVGVMNRVHAQVLSGLEPGEVVAVGLKQTDAERAPRDPQQQRRMRPSL